MRLWLYVYDNFMIGPERTDFITGNDICSSFTFGESMTKENTMAQEIKELLQVI